jgi:hypothetical protein
MAQLINEAKRMQFLAGLITESQLNEESIKSLLKQKEDVVKVLSPLKGTILNLVGLSEDKKPNGCTATATVSNITNEYYPQGSNSDPDYFEISPKLIFTISNEKLGSNQEENNEFKKTLEDIKETPCKISGGGSQKVRIIMDANSAFLGSYDIGATKESTFFKKLEEILKVDIQWKSKGGDLLALEA